MANNKLVTRETAKKVREAMDKDYIEGKKVVGHSQVADNLTPYSEDSGVTQDAPFISQGTGTDNNSAIVTTGVIAKQLEKQGNTVTKNMIWDTSSWLDTFTTNDITFTKNSAGNYTLNGTSSYSGEADYFDASFKYANTPIINGHKYLWGGFGLSATGINYAISKFGTSYSTNQGGIYAIATANATQNDAPFILRIAKTASFSNAKVYGLICVDLTQWFNGNANIPADLLAHPEHFSWYYNGSLAYDAGSLANCNGRYLECGQGRNLFNKDTATRRKCINNNDVEYASNNNFHSDYMICIPNKPVFFKGVVNWDSASYVLWYDANKNLIGVNSSPGTAPLTVTATAPANAWFMRINGVLSAIDNADVELYYTPEQGGEGYGEMHDYIAPIRIDTGNEVLRSASSAKDVKLPSGVITRNVLWLDIGNIPDESLSNVANHIFRNRLSKLNIKPNTSNSVLYINVACPYFTQKTYAEISASDNMCFAISGDESLGDRIVFIDQSCSTINEFKTKWNGKYIAVEIETPTTEQGTPFSEYAPINDYSYMAWFDTDGNLVSIPQGCKLFYPVDYKGFTDDLVMYTNGDATALAKNEDITDSALNARGYYKMQDLSSDCQIGTGLTVAALKLMKIGRMTVLTLRAKNTSGAALTAHPTLVTLPATADFLNWMAYPIMVDNVEGTAMAVLSNNTITSSIDIPNNASVYINLAYVANH